MPCTSVDVSNSYFHHISWDEIPCWLHGKAYCSQTPCQACLKNGTLPSEGDNLGHAENEVRRVAVLTDFPIYFGTLAKLWVFDDLDTEKSRAWTNPNHSGF
jgi:hypothetical protein